MKRGDGQPVGAGTGCVSWGVPRRNARHLECLRLDHLRPSPLRWSRVRQRLRCALLLALGAQLAGCATVQEWQGRLVPGADAAEEAPAATATSRELHEGAFQRGRIHCQAGDCRDGWTITLPARGRLRVEVYAPVGEAVPAFELGLEDEAGTSLRRVPPAAHSPRRLTRTVPAGTYRVVIASVGSEKGPLTYEVVYRLGQRAKDDARSGPRAAEPRPRAAGGTGAAPSEPVRASEPATVPSETGRSAPPVQVPTPEPVDPVMRAEVIGVDEGDAGATRVWLDRGRPDGFAAGVRGKLVDDGRTIGRFEVVESYETGSVANVTGRLRGEISERTVAEIPTPSGPQ